MSNGPERTAGTLLAASLLGVAYADFHSYVLTFYANPDAWGALLRGSANAPEQYRVGVLQLAAFLSRHAGLRLDHAFTLIDLGALLLSGWLVLRNLIRGSAYRSASPTRRCFALAGLLFLVQFYLAWLLSPQRAETLPSALLVLTVAALLEAPLRAARTLAPRLLILAGVAVLGCTFRPDIVFALGSGLVLGSLARRPGVEALPRAWAATAGSLCAALAVGAHLYLSRAVYPHATYGRVKLWQLRPNFVHPERWLPFLLFMLPLLWTVRRSLQQPRSVRDSQRILLLSAGCYFALWITVGKLDEVRLMLPFALALAPLTIEFAMRQIEIWTHTPATRPEATEFSMQTGGAERDANRSDLALSGAVGSGAAAVVSEPGERYREGV